MAERQHVAGEIVQLRLTLPKAAQAASLAARTISSFASAIGQILSPASLRRNFSRMRSNASTALLGPEWVDYRPGGSLNAPSAAGLRRRKKYRASASPAFCSRPPMRAIRARARCGCRCRGRPPPPGACAAGSSRIGSSCLGPDVDEAERDLQAAAGVVDVVAQQLGQAGKRDLALAQVAPLRAARDPAEDGRVRVPAGDPRPDLPAQLPQAALGPRS